MLDLFRIRRGSLRLPALVLVACALLLRVLVPQGWMPVADADGWRLTLCPGSGPMEIAGVMTAMPGMDHGGDHQDHGASDHPCAFAGLAMALDAPPPLFLPLLRPVPGRWIGGTGILVTVGRGLAAPPPPATGPPLV